MKKAACNQNCPKCGTNYIHRQHRMPGKEVRLSIGERNECKPRLPYLDSDWPYGWKTKREHISHHCRVCGHEWECDVVQNFALSHADEK